MEVHRNGVFRTKNNITLKSVCSIFSVPHTSEVHQYVQLLTECCLTSGNGNAAALDEVGRWCAGVIDVGACWLAGDDDGAQKLYPVVDVFPKYFQQSE